jgi:hypothetical protein
MERIDPLTKRTFIAKRTNQRFETRENQIRYNNLKARKTRMKLAPWDKALKKNYRILMGILGNLNEKQVDQLELKYKGYDATVFSQFKSGKDIKEFGVFHLTVREHKNGRITIINEE